MADKDRDIEIATDFKHQRRLWLVERVGWAVIALLVIAVLLGLLGTGPLSKATAGTEHSALWADYQRFDRREAPSTFRVHVGSEALKDQLLRLWLSREYLNKTTVEHITPEPEAQEVASDRVVYVFKLAGTNTTVTITFEVRRKDFGRSQIRLGVIAGPEISFNQLTYP